MLRLSQIGHNARSRKTKAALLAAPLTLGLIASAGLTWRPGGAAAEQGEFGQTLFGSNNERPVLRLPLILRDEGMFFVNGEKILSDYPSASTSGTPPTPASFVVNQMFVHYRIPAVVLHKLPIIMVHGSGLTGMSYETTPDGREGWATYFTRLGFKVYVVDFPGRGRAGFNPTPLNQAKTTGDLTGQPSLSRTGLESAWVQFRMGPTDFVPFPGVQAPEASNGGINEAVAEQFSAQGVPNGESTLTPASSTTVPAAIDALLEKVGPAILMVHSQAGNFADAAVTARPDLVKMMIHVESNCGTLSAAALAAYKQVPNVLYIHGDNVIGNTAASTGQPRLTACTAAMTAINANGGRATLTQLPNVGIHGNCHMMMQDKNNLDVADYIIKQIVKNRL
jgi:pimeloyl-ACP methyl ester carboxylesterase